MPASDQARLIAWTTAMLLARVADDVTQHLTELVGTDAELTLEIQATLPDGASDNIVRDVIENCRTSRFESFGFEEA